MDAQLFTRRNVNAVPIIRQKLETESTLEIAGLRNVVLKNTPIINRILWLIIFFLALGLCIYQIKERLAHFMDDPSSTDKYYVYNQSLNFPSITICPFNGMHPFPSINSILAERQLDHFSTENISEVFRNKNTFIEDLWSVAKNNYTNMEVYVTDAQENRFLPSQSIAVTEEMTTLGTCMRFTPLRSLDYIGGDTSMTIVTSGTEILEDAVVAYSKNENGEVSSYFAHRWVKLNLLTENSFKFNIRIIEEIYRNTKKLPCTNGKDSNLCLAKCLNALILSNTSKPCRLPYMLANEQIPMCRTWQQFSDVRRATIWGTSVFNPEKCSCPRKCKVVVYEVESNIWIYRNAYENGTYEWTFLIPENRYYITEEKQLYSALNLFSDFGGTLGLYLGLCVLSILEIGSACLSKIRNNYILKNKPLNNIRNKQGPRAIVRRKTAIPSTTNPFLSVPGFNKATEKNSSTFSRYLWLVITLVALCALILQCAERIAFFLSEPTLDNIYYSNNRTIKLPSVMLCPAREDNLIPAVQLVKYSRVKQAMVLYLDSEIKQFLEDGEYSIAELWNISDVYFEISGRGPEVRFHEKEVYTILGLCKYFLPIFGMLFLLPGYKWLRGKAAEGSYGTGNELFYKGRETDFLLQLEGLYVGKYRVIYLNAVDLPQIRYLALHTGYTTNEGFIKDTLIINEVKKLNSRTHPCEKGSIVSQCLANCIEENILSKLDHPCWLPFMKRSFQLPECATLQGMEIMLNKSIQVAQKFRREECDCPRRCLERVYTVDTAVRLFPLPTKFNIALHLSISTNKILVIGEEAAYSIISLLSDIGGCMSLVLGLCGLQIVELLMFTIRRPMSYCEQHRKKANAPHNRREIVLIIRNECLETNNSVTIPGFHQMLNENSTWQRIVWSLITFVALLITSYQCGERIDHYHSDSSIASVYNLYNESIRFPSLIQCYTTGVPINPSFYVQRKNVKELFGHFKTFMAKWNKNQVSNEILWNLTRIEVNDTQFWLNNVPANDSIVTSEINTPLGICSVFQSGNIVPYNGAQTMIQGLIITPADIEETHENLVSTISIFPTDDVPLARFLMHKHMIVATGPTQLDLRITLTLRRDTVKQPCHTTEKVNDCLMNCFNKMQLDKMETPCRFPFMLDSDPVPDCQTHIRKVFNERWVTNKLYIEDCSCPKKCDEYNYIIEDTRSKYIKDLTRYEWKVNIPNNKISVIKEEKAYTFFKLLSDLGGTAGFLFGVGFLQIAEIAVAFYQKVFYR